MKRQGRQHEELKKEKKATDKLATTSTPIDIKFEIKSVGAISKRRNFIYI